jgi:pyroglutamyl-peptidase
MLRALLRNLAVTTAALAGCTTTPAAPGVDPNAGLFRDFADGKFDGAGHPLDAVVVEAATLCPSAHAVDGGIALSGQCAGELPAAARAGDLVASARIRVRKHGSGTIATVSIVRTEGGTVLARKALKASSLRANDVWLDLPISWHGDGSSVTISVMPASNAKVDLAYVEVFPPHFTLALAPGSGTFVDSDHVQIEVPKGGKLDHVILDGADITAQATALLASGKATRTDTAFRSVVDFALSDLAPMRGDVAELALRAAGNAARMQVRRTAPACQFEGDPAGAKVIVTGFQPFPADATHENVSAVAVGALDPATLHGAQVMKLILPVEYDRSAAEIADAIARCQPDVTISFGQGGDEIALEEVAYNLQDTGELSGGAPDNRGIVRSATPIDETAPPTRDTQLPLAQIEKALVAAGETPAHSRDPGRYICNNVMFADVGAMTALGAGRAGFIHLPYTTEFDDAARARFGAVVAAAIQATVDHP